MNPQLLLTAVLLSGSSERVPKLLQRILPVTMGQAAFPAAVLIASRDLQRQEQAEKDRAEADREVVKEIVDTIGISDPNALKSRFPKVHESLFLKLLPAEQEKIFQAPPTGDSRTAAAKKT